LGIKKLLFISEGTAPTPVGRLGHRRWAHYIQIAACFEMTATKRPSTPKAPLKNDHTSSRAACHRLCQRKSLGHRERWQSQWHQKTDK
jgi:hypothetical protein